MSRIYLKIPKQKIVIDKKNLHINAYSSSFTHNITRHRSDLDTFNGWMDKQTVVQPHNEILFSDKKKKQLLAMKRYGGTLNAYC